MRRLCLHVWRAGLVAVLLLAGGIVAVATADDCPDSPTSIYWSSYLQFWWSAWEQVNTGLVQPLSGDKATNVASGFSLRRARLSADFTGDRLRGRISLRLEGTPPGLLDAYVTLPIHGGQLELCAGQMKIPATYETATSSAKLDFLSRTWFSRAVVNLSLSKSPSLLSPRFNGVNAYLRDFGLAIKGRIGSGDYFMMISNGLGANRFIGGPEHKQELYTNRLGAYCYAARLDWDLLSPEGGMVESPFASAIDALAIGGHALWNDHPNAILDDERTVLDIKRYSWSADLCARFCKRVDVTVMFGKGKVLDDLDNDDRDDYRYSGWELKAMAPVYKRRLAVGLRYDTFTDESFENGFEISRQAFVFGLSCLPRPALRIQFELKRKIYPDRPENIDDENLVLLAAQVDFG